MDNYMRVPPTQTISIVYADLLIRPKYLHCPKTGKHDIVGQILYSLGHNVPPKARLISDLHKHIPPFTVSVRGNVIDSAVSIELHLTSLNIHPRELVPVCNRILADHKVAITLVKS